ncbi:MAG: hypothetical protein GY710_02150 [Desulfobacteraceae bacterium]|nr:hypothetical protein [Desulfobacteraceae bacterium]
MNQFKRDDEFSKHKDLLLKPYWKTKSFEGRFVITGSELLQKTHGIDIVLQYDEYNDLTVDTKHTRPFPKIGSETFFLEEMSNTNPKYNTLGWILKESGHPDYILFFVHNRCYKCYQDCFKKCNSNILRDSFFGVLKFSVLRQWFIDNKERFPLKQTGQINKTSGRIVGRYTLLNEVGMFERDFMGKPNIFQAESEAESS